MAIKDITRESVLAAIREFDQVGRDAFLEKYGFRRSYLYQIRFDGKQYDSKAVLGAAHRIQFPDQPMPNFGGGDPTREILEPLGFEWEALGPRRRLNMRPPGSWVFQYNPRQFELLDNLDSDGGEWAANQHRDEIASGDRVYFYRSGQNAGITAVGTVTSDEARELDTPNAFGRWKVDVTYDLLVDPIVSRSELLTDEVLGSVGVFQGQQGTNFPLTDESAERLEEVLEARTKVIETAVASAPMAASSFRLAVLREASEVAAAERLLRESFSVGGLLVRANLGYQGGGATADVYWRDDAQIWACLDDVPGESSPANRYWNAFGLERPREGAGLSITCEINVPRDGVNRSIAASFAQSADGSTYLVHRGLIGGGREGVGREAFWSRFSGSRAVLDDGTETAVAVVARLGEPTTAQAIGDFVREVARIKDEATGQAMTQSAPVVWVEKTNVQGRPDRMEGDFAVGAALWSPAKSKTGTDIYRLMRDVAPGDIVLHLTDRQAFTGISRVASAYEDFAGVEGTQWPVGPWYLVRLKEYERLDPPLGRETFLTGDYATRLVALLEAGTRNLFYNREPNLNQGGYLTPLPADAVVVLNDAYMTVAGRPLVVGMTATRRSEPVLPEEDELVAPTAANLSEWLWREHHLVYSPSAVATFLTALQTSGFVILGGVSGTGKTKLAQAVAEAMAAEGETNHLFLPVRPDWRDSRPLVGYYNPLRQEYEATELLRLVLRALRYEPDDGETSLEEALAAQGEWTGRIAEFHLRIISKAPTEFTDEDIYEIWRAKNNAISNSGRATLEGVSMEGLRNATAVLADASQSLGARVIGALDALQAGGATYLPLLRTLRALAVFAPAQVTTLVDPRRSWEVAQQFFEWKGPGLRRLAHLRDVDRMNKYFEMFAQGARKYAGASASAAECAITPWLLSTLDAPTASTAPVESADPPLPYFITLDEMNLARVEYYFADFLSVLESGRDDSTLRLTKEGLRLHDHVEGELDAATHTPIPARLRLPANLYFVGTINVDETTHVVSPKVLDRAFTLEMNEIDFKRLLAPVGAESVEVDLQALTDAFSRGGEFVGADEKGTYAVEMAHPEFASWLQWLSDRLRPYDLQFAYRSYREVLGFVVNAVGAPWEDGFDGPEGAFDTACLSKVLPKFSGPRGRLREPLVAVLAWAVDPSAPSEEAVLAQLESPTWVPAAPRLPQLAAKALRMIRQVDRAGFVSFV